MTEFFVELNPVPEYELNGKLESEARALECRMRDGHSVMMMSSENEIVPLRNRNCSASACAHWRWLHKGATRYEKQSFQSEHPVPDGLKAPADVPEGWVFMHWDNNVHAAKKNGGNPATPRFWASRAVEIILPRGLCGLAGEE